MVGEIQMVNRIHSVVPAEFNTSQLNLHMNYRALIGAGFLYNYFVTLKDNTVFFFILGDTVFNKYK